MMRVDNYAKRPKKLGRLVFLYPACALALGIEGSSYDLKARRRGIIAPERPNTLDNKMHKVYKKHMPKNNTSTESLSIPDVAKRLNVHRNTVLYWVREGFVKAYPKNSIVSRPQFLIPLDEVKRIERERHVKA